jgi:CDP-glucose 4,6-dehydratase
LQKPCSVVIVTTDKVYENKEVDYAYKESDKLGGYDPYSASKAAAEIVVSSYRTSFFNAADFNKHKKAIATGRAGNVIGGGDWAADRIVPDIIRSLQKGEPVIVRNPEAIRPWQHVLEPLSGYLLLGANLVNDPVKYGAAWNFGPAQDDVLTVKELVGQVIQCFGKGSYTTPVTIGQPHEAHLLQLDISKALHEMGWSPKMKAHTAIQLTVDWYKEAAASNASDLVREQILKYQSS